MAMRANVGKFNTALDEAIYALSLDGPDREAGSSTEPPHLWAGMLRFGKGLADAIKDDRASYPNVTDAQLKFLDTDGEAGVIVTENDNGHVEVHYYKERAALDKDWKELEEELESGDEGLEANSSVPLYHIRYVHKISPSQKDVLSGVAIPDNAFSDKNKLGAALRRAGVMGSGGRVNSFRVEGDKVIVFPSMPGLTTYWHSIIIEPEGHKLPETVRGHRPNGSISRQKIQEALAYVHHWEAPARGKDRLTRAQAARDAIRFSNLNKEEADILLRSIHVTHSELGRAPRGYGFTNNSSIADRRKAGVIEGLTKAEMDSMEIRIPDWGGKWKQVGGDMNPGAYGGVVATADGQAIEIIEIQSVTDLVGEGEAKDVGFPFWTKEGYYDLDDLQLTNEGVQSSIESAGLGEHLLDMTPEQRAMAIAEVCLRAGHRSEEGDGGWSTDILGGRQIEWASGEVAGNEYLAEEDGEFRREVLGQVYETLVDGSHNSWSDDADDAIEEAQSDVKRGLFLGHVQVIDRTDDEVLWDSNDEEQTPNRKKQRSGHTPNPSSSLESDGTLDELLEMQAETMEPRGSGRVPQAVKNELRVTDEVRQVASDYEDALLKCLEWLVENYPPEDGATAQDLFYDNAPYLVLMTINGSGRSIWDGDWDSHYEHLSQADRDKIDAYLERTLRKFDDIAGGGLLPEALSMAVYEAMREAGYGFDEHTYVPIDEGGVLDVDFSENRRRSHRRNGSGMQRWHVFLNDELTDTVYFDPDMGAEDVKRSLVSHDGYDPRIVVSQPPARRTNLPPEYRSTTRMVGNEKWTRAYMNRLPDSAFLYVEPGGQKDDQGKTVPRSLRHFPFKDIQGHVNEHHLNNALSRIPQSTLPESAKRTALSRAHGVKEHLR